MLIIYFRTIILFMVLLLGMRLTGKRQLGELEVSELVIAVLISEFAAHPLQDIRIPLLNGLLPIIILFCCGAIISGLTAKSIRARVFFCGKPSLMISNGKIIQQEMKKNRFTLDELAEELRYQGINDISTVQFAVLETDGKLNAIQYPGERPVSANDLGIEVHDMAYPTIIINEGHLLESNLRRMDRDPNWLKGELKQRNIKNIKDVYYMTVDLNGNIYFAEKELKK